MRDIIYKASDTDKRIAIALKRSIRLSYVLSIGAISVGGLSSFSVAAILGTKPAHATIKEQPVSSPDQTTKNEQAFPASSDFSESTCTTAYNPTLGQGSSSQTIEIDARTTVIPQGSQNTAKTPTLNDASSKALERATATDSQTLVKSADLDTPTNAPPARQDFCNARNAQPECQVDMKSTCRSQPGQTVWSPTHLSTAQSPIFTLSNQTQAAKFKFTPIELAQSQPVTVAAVNPTLPDTPLPSSFTKTTPTPGNQFTQRPPSQEQPTLVSPANPAAPITSNLANYAVEGNNSKPLTVRNNSPQPPLAHAPTPNPTKPALQKGSGGASLLGGNIQAQSPVQIQQQPASSPEQAAVDNNPLAPSLLLQGGFITQGDDTGARARLTGLYPISPNALFGGTVDLTTGRGFSDTPGTGLQLSELYFTGSLPSLPGLRLTVGLMDLTSYFDRNSFAKDSLTHFFNPVFQTNPALAAAGISSRPGALLNWDITDNLQARAAAFSSSRSLGSFAIDAFAGELAFRAGNAIVRGTYVTDRDAGRNNGFREIYGIPRSNGDFGIRSGDRENAYGINAEYFIPQLNMGLFGRYGHYDNTSIGKGGDTYSLGLNFLDLFMPNDRLGFGYGQDLSNNDLRRASGKKVPDVWELFYDIRVLSNLRAGVTLQARNEFSDIVAGFRVRTEFDLLKGLFR